MNQEQEIMMKVIVNNIEFVFARNPYGTHDWCATDYNDEYDIEYMYCGNLEVMNFIHYLLDHTDQKQQTVLYGLLKLVSDSYLQSVGEQFARYDVSYRDSLNFSIGKRIRKYQLTKLEKSWE